LISRRREAGFVVGVAALLLASIHAYPAWSHSIDPIAQRDPTEPIEPIDQSAAFSKQVSLSELPDGSYQLCTEPDPGDWTDGAGTCLNIVKQGQYASGYYGYPHSSRFICLRGEILETSLIGEALFAAWSAHHWSNPPQEEFSWDAENRLMLANGMLIAAVETDRADPIEWVTFQQARLDTQDLYLYPSPRTTEPSQLCDWSNFSTP